MIPTAALVGLGGYGAFYLRLLLADDSPVRLVAGVDPAPERCQHLDALRARGVAIVPRLEDLPGGMRIDLAIVASPIQFHCAQTCALLARGCHVLCEKPLAATVQEAATMARAEAAAQRRVGIGYQWSFSDAVLGLKRDILAGRLGRPRRLRTLVMWNRDDAYYARSSWAGALRAADGAWILDSPVNNATAHFLHNMLFVLGAREDAAAAPASVQAELHRANAIANYDTAVLRVRTLDGVDLHFATTHCSDRHLDPVFTYEFERAMVTYRHGQGGIVARFTDGTVREYGDPERETAAKLATMAAAVRGGPVPCGIATALPHLVVMNGAQECRAVAPFPTALVARTEAPQRVQVTGLADQLERAHAEAKLPSELGYTWAVPGETIDLRSYATFPAKPRAWL